MIERSTDDRFLELVIINIGEALTEFGNLRQRGFSPGQNYAKVRASLERAIAASDGKVIESPPDQKDYTHSYR